ncbi:MAG: sialidase family protein, partial [Acidobacteriota bacterium]
STTLRDPALPAAFDGFSTLDLGGSATVLTGPNPGGLLGQIWVATDPTRPSNVYVLASLDPPGPDPLDVFFARSEDGGLTWSAPVRVVSDSASAWQWFGTLSVAPNGRLDAVWNDTRDDPGGFDSKLFYASSEDAGATWSAAEELTPAFDPLLGFPVQNKIGDYYDMVSENERVHVAYSATFNGEQDVYYLEIPIDSILFADGFENGLSAWSSSQP